MSPTHSLAPVLADILSSPSQVGHILVLFGTLYTLFGLVTFSTRSRSYYLSYAGAIVSWGIVVVRPLPPVLPDSRSG